MGTCRNFKHWDTHDVFGEKKKENLITLGVHPGYSCDVGCSRGGDTGKPVACPLVCHQCLFLNLPTYSSCALKGEKSDICHSCKSYRIIEMCVLELETQPAAPSIIPSNSFKVEPGLYLLHWADSPSY